MLIAMLRLGPGVLIGDRMGNQKDRPGTKLLQNRSDAANATIGYSDFVFGVFSHFNLDLASNKKGEKSSDQTSRSDKREDQAILVIVRFNHMPNKRLP